MGNSSISWNFVSSKSEYCLNKIQCLPVLIVSWEDSIKPGFTMAQLVEVDLLELNWQSNEKGVRRLRRKRILG